MFTLAERAATWRTDVPELHLDQAELLEVRAQLKGPENGILLGQHDQRGAGQAAVDVQAEPEPEKRWTGRWKRVGRKTGMGKEQNRWEREKKKKEKSRTKHSASYWSCFVCTLLWPPCAVRQPNCRLIHLATCVGGYSAPAERIKLAGRGESAISDLQLRAGDCIRIQARLCRFHLKVQYVRIPALKHHPTLPLLFWLAARLTELASYRQLKVLDV